MGYQTFDYQHVQDQELAFNPGSGPQTFAFYSGIATPYAIDNVLVTNSDSVPHTVKLHLNGSTPYQEILTVIVPANAGIDGTTPAVDLMASLPASITRLVVRNGSPIYATVMETITTGLVALYGQGGSFYNQ